MRLLLGPHFQIIFDRHALAVENKIAIVRLLVERVEQFVEHFDQQEAIPPKRIPPFAVPVGVRNDVSEGRGFWRHDWKSGCKISGRY